MKKLEEIKKHLSNGGAAFFRTKRIAQIDLNSMNMGGKIKIRLEGSTRKIEIDIEDILF